LTTAVLIGRLYWLTSASSPEVTPAFKEKGDVKFNKIFKDYIWLRKGLLMRNENEIIKVLTKFVYSMVLLRRIQLT
jgi:hypothetical protein